MSKPIRVRRGRIFEQDGWRYYDPDPVPPKPAPPTWRQRNWPDLMNWAVALPCAGYLGAFLHPELAPAWHWMTGLGLLVMLITWCLRPGR